MLQHDGESLVAGYPEHDHCKTGPASKSDPANDVIRLSKPRRSDVNGSGWSYVPVFRRDGGDCFVKSGADRISIRITVNVSMLLRVLDVDRSRSLDFFNLFKKEILRSRRHVFFVDHHLAREPAHVHVRGYGSKNDGERSVGIAVTRAVKRK